MDNLLTFRNNAIFIYKKYDLIFNTIIKGIIGFILYSSIFQINNYNEILAPVLNGSLSFVIMILFIILFLILPMSMNLLLMSLLLVVMISSHIYLAGILFFVFLTIFICYVRLAEKECLILVLTIFAFKFNMPYLIPLICAIYLPITFIFPLAIGSYVYFLINNLENTIGLFTSPEYLELDIISQFSFVLDNVLTSSILNETFIFMTFTLISMALISFIINRLEMDRVELISIISAGIIGIVGIILIAFLKNNDINIILNIFTCILSCLIAIVITFFDGFLDYESSRKVRFSDENNVYYVKVVPKVSNSHDIGWFYWILLLIL